MAQRNFVTRFGEAVRHVLTPQTTTRGYDGARLMTDRNARFGPYVSEASASTYRLRQRSRYYGENNPYFQAAIRALATNAVAAGIVAASTHPDPATRALLSQLFAQFAARADFDGLTNLGGLESAFMSDLARDGEALAIMRNTDAGLAIQRLPVEFLDETQTRDLGGGAYIQNGVEFGPEGRRAYHIFPSAPANSSAQTIQSIRVPAEDVLHIFEARGAGQCRGTPWGAAALKRIGEIDQLEDALLVGTKTAAMMCAFITDEFGSSTLPFDGEQSGSTLTSGMEPGAILNMGAGKKITTTAPAQAAQGVEFLASQIRAVASAFGVPPHLIDSDYSRANYSSLRASLVSYAARLDQIVHTILVPQLLNRIWRRWITTEILRGAIAAPDFETNPDVWFGVEWFPPAPPVADEIKAAQADVLQITNGLKSRSQAIRERGYVPEALDEERAADAERATAMGLDKPATAKSDEKKKESENV